MGRPAIEKVTCLIVRRACHTASMALFMPGGEGVELLEARGGEDVRLLHAGMETSGRADGRDGARRGWPLAQA